MNPIPWYVKVYTSARQRFLAASLERFLERQCPKMLGPLLLHKLVEHLVKLVEGQLPAKDHLRPGQMVWNAVSLQTRPDHPQRQLVPVILTLIEDSDIQELQQGVTMGRIAQKAVARILREAYAQGALLTMRDIGLFSWRGSAGISYFRKAWEQEHQQVLPHPGSLQDFGSCISHKNIILQKVLVEKKDPRWVAKETRHSQAAVDRYLQEYHRVVTCYSLQKDSHLISLITGIAHHVVLQYLSIYSQIGESHA
jgi:hypothetical protein